MSEGSQDGAGAPPTPEPEFLPGFATVDAYSQASLRQILLATKLSNAIPGDKKDWDYYDTFSGFRSVMAKQNSDLRDMIKKQFEYNGVKGRVGGATDVAELVDMLSDANDAILERVSMNLDEAAGLIIIKL